MEESHFAVPRELLKHAPEMSLSAVLIYLQFCSRLEHDGNAMSVSTADLAAITRLKQRTVFTALAHLKRLGLIQREPTGPTKTSQYRLLVPEEHGVKGHAPSIFEAVVRQEAAAIIVQTAQAPSESGQSLIDAARDTSAAPGKNTETLDELIASVYSTKCRVGDLHAYVDLREGDLRKCLEWLRAERGVDAETPMRFFAAAILMAWKRISGG